MTLDDILFYCTRARFKEAKHIGKEALKSEIQGLKKRRHTGPICLSFDGEAPSYEWIIFHNGDIKLAFVEDWVGDRKTLKRLDGVLYEEGDLEIFEFSERQGVEVWFLLHPMSKDDRERLREGCIATLLEMRNILTMMFGRDCAEKIMKKQYKDLNLNERNLSCVDVRLTIDSLIHNVIRKFLGVEKAAKAARKFDAYFS